VPVVTVSPTYQVVIPKEVREQLGLRPGQKVEAFAVGNRVELVPVEPMRTLTGAFPDLPPLQRDPERL
jgi:AbrB family looped-hinge helix DNA binding protein